jgi:hypothetical protein
VVESSSSTIERGPLVLSIRLNFPKSGVQFLSLGVVTESTLAAVVEVAYSFCFHNDPHTAFSDALVIWPFA